MPFSTSSMRTRRPNSFRFMRLAFADHDAVGFEQAQYLLWIMALGLENPCLSLRDHPLDQRQIMTQRALLAQHPQHRIGPRTEFSTGEPKQNCAGLRSHRACQSQ